MEDRSDRVRALPVRVPRRQPPGGHRQGASGPPGAPGLRLARSRSRRARVAAGPRDRGAARGRMRVFVAGATGAIGRPLVAQLLAAGHEPTGMARSAKKADELRAAGARAAVCDALEADALRRVVVEAAPEVLVHQLTDLPKEWSMRYGYGATSKLRY